MANKNTGLAIINDALKEVTANLPTSIKVGDKDITDKALITMNAKATLLVMARKISDKAMCVESAKIALEEVKKYGFSSVEKFIGKMFELELSSNQIRDYYRVGRIFADTTKNGYHWKKGIPESTTLANLRDCLSLVFEDCQTKESKNVDILKDSELNKLFDDFMSKYGKECPFQGSNSTLREWKAGLKKSKDEDANTIDTTADEIPNSDKPADNVPSVKKSDKAMAILEDINLQLMTLMGLYMDDKSIESICLDIKAKLDSIDIDTSDDTEPETEPETETETE